MKRILFAALLLFAILGLKAQAIIKTSGTIYFANEASMHLYVPDESFSSETCITLNNGKAYTWDRVIDQWIPIDNTGTDDQQISLAGTTLTLENGGSVDLSTLQDGTGTDDQALSLVGTTLSLEDGGSVDISLVQDGTGTDDQALSLVGTTLSLEDGGSVDLSLVQDGTGTDDQALSLVGTTLSLEDGGSVDLSLVQDGTGTDDQTISLVGTTLSIESGNSVDLSPVQDGTGTDDQAISLSGSVLTLEDGGSVDLSALISGGGTDDQTLSLAGTTLSIESGNSVDLSTLQDGTGTDDQQISLSGTTLTLEDGGSVDLSALQDGTGTDDQTLGLAGTTLSIESGNSVDLAILQDGTGTDDQQISLSGTTLTLEDGGNVDLSILQDGTGTDDQTLSLAGTTLSIESGNSVNLSTLQDGTGTDDQQLSLASNVLTLEDGGSVNLSGYLDNTDDQILSLSGTTLSIESGNSVNLSALQDGNTNIYNANGSLPASTIRSIQFGNNASRFRYFDPGNIDQYFDLFNNTTLNGTAGLFLLDDDNVHSGTVGMIGTGAFGVLTTSTASVKGGFASLINTPGTAWFSVDASNIARMHSTAADYRIGSAGSPATLLDLNNTLDRIVVYDQTTAKIYYRSLASIQDGTGTDDQTLSLAGTTLSIEDGNSVDLATLQDGTGTDDQNLSLSGNTLSIEDGNSVDLSSVSTASPGYFYGRIRTGNVFASTATSFTSWSSESAEGDFTSMGNGVYRHDGASTKDVKFDFSAVFSVTQSRNIEVEIFINGAASGLSRSFTASTSFGLEVVMQFSYIIKLSPSDTIDIRVTTGTPTLNVSIQNLYWVGQIM